MTAPPTRIQPAINLQNHISGALQAREDIQAAIGMYAANIGKQSNAQSGVAYTAQKQQGEASTANFPANLAASIGQVGRICLEMIPRLIDTRRQVRILGIDGTPGSMTMDPAQDGAAKETPEGLVVNPNVGRYDVRVVVGSCYATQRQETSQALTEMIRANPEMMPVVGPLWAQTLDFPNADKLAQVLTAMAPPQVQAVLNPGADKQPTTADLMAQVEQLKQALKEATSIAHEAQQDLDEAQAKAEASQAELEIKAYEAETKRLVGLKDAITPESVQALVVQTINNMLSHPEPLGNEGENEGPGLDGSAPHELAEGEQPGAEQPEAEQPEEMQPMQGMETETPEPMPEMGEEL